MSSASEHQAFCGHCGERLPAYGSQLGFCGGCARRFKKSTHGPRPLPLSGGLAYPKDPLLALVLAAVFPGAGQVYNGHFIKAVLVFVLAPLVLPWLIGIADAFFSARRISAEFAYANGAAAA